MEIIQPNQTGTGPRRSFENESEWKRITFDEVSGGIQNILSRYRASIDFDINGDASVTADITIQEFVLLNGQDEYFHQTIDLPRWWK